VATLIILDTDVLIDYFRGIEGARHYLEALPVTHRKITEITVMELFKGARNKKELQQIEQFLLANEFSRMPVTSKASSKAVSLLREYGLSKGLSIPDALIAAIALEAESELVSGNKRHFSFIKGLQVIDLPYRQHHSSKRGG